MQTQGNYQFHDIARKGCKAFTLVELSIVLIIIGLIISGILVGSTLIQGAKLRAIIKEKDSYTTALYRFIEKYGGLPGDLANAYSYWGAGCAATAADCNGSGDYQIWNNSGPDNNEALRFWQHLGLAGLVSDGFTGAGTAADEPLLGQNIPRGPLEGSGYLYYYENWSGITKNGLALASIADDGALWGGIISPPDAYAIDMKVDDGNALTGRTQGANGKGVTCLGGGLTGYLLTSSDLACRIRFIIY